MRATTVLLAALLAGGLSACSGLPSSPTQPARYDLGASPVRTEGPAATTFPVLALADIQARAQNENSTSLLYRLGYADANALHAYGLARWSQPPAVLVQQRMREILSQNRTILSAEGGAQPALVGDKAAPVLTLALEEFEHTFSAATNSTGTLRLRATLVEPRRGGDVLLGQQVFSVQQAARTANAAGGAQALAQAVNQAGVQLQQWLAQLPSLAPTTPPTVR